MTAGHIESNLKRRHFAIFQVYGELHLRAVGLQIGGINIGTIIQAVSRERFADFRQNGAHVFAVGTHKRFAIKRHTVDKINKSLMQFIDAVAVSIHVVGIDIGDHGNNWG